MKKVKLQLKVKTNLKAGEHCHDALAKFKECCKGDSNCLK